MVYRQMSGTTKSAPKLTIGLPVYNSERYLKESVDSLLGLWDWAVGFFGYAFDEMIQDLGNFTELALDLEREARTLEASVFR